MDKQLFLEQLYSLIIDEPDIIANLSNISAFLNETIENINWVGFYLIKDDELVLGPFQGKVACVRIPVGKGVCGTAVYRKRMINVPDIFHFKDHIVCDSSSRSEIVFPIIVNNQIVGVLDIDAPCFNRFTGEDEIILQDAVHIIEEIVFNKKTHFK